MPLSAVDTLQHYWGYDSFRPKQAEIIDSILNGIDTLGLLPTGGGKSLTFQVPAMMLDGLTIVVTPLISLMKDQVDNLADRGIRAVALHSGLTRAEHRLGIERCELGKAKILYVSPERLQSKFFIDRLRFLPVSLIVVDEAHCISQWGYDFRPSYLKIAALRKLFPQAPVLALTASATPEVADDIMNQLQFRSRNVLARSFSRDNISYIVRHTDHKEEMLLRVLSSTTGCSIVYVRSRKRSRELVDLLRSNGISADFYHAGLAVEDKNEKQNRWRNDQIRVIVATNAFGMGIDKPNVRVVVHYDPPSSLEEYYQEAGRAGRDGLHSFAVVIASTRDKATLTRRLSESFPPKDEIRRVYELACNFVDVAVGSGFNSLFEFNFSLFCERFKLNPTTTHSALGILTRAGYFDYVDEIATRSRLIINATRQELYSLRVDTVTDNVLQLILRTYTGLFADYVHISETLIASRLKISEEQVYQSLLKLQRERVLHYVPKKSTPYLLLTTSRELPKHVELPRQVYEDQRRRMELRIDAMKRFIFDTDACRVKGMLQYFGETEAQDCGHCDICRARKPKSPEADKRIEATICYLASRPEGSSVQHIAQQLSMALERVTPIVRRLADSGKIVLEGSIVKQEGK